MPQYLPLPDGNSVTIREGETPEQAWARAQEMYPESFGIRPAAKPSSGNGLSDIATAFKQGAVGSTKALTDIFGAENAASTSLDKTAEELQKDYSTSRQAELKAQAARMKKAEQSGSLWEEIKAAAQNVAEAPLQAAAQGVGSFVPYLPTMFVGPIAGALRLAKPTILALEGLAGSAQKLIGTAQGAGAVKGSIYDAVYEKEVQAGVEPEIAKQKAIAAQEYLGKNWEQIALGGAIGRVAAGSGVEKLLTKQGAEAAADKVGRRVGQAVLQEGLTEAPQGGQERLAANLALQREGYDTPLFQGVAGAATQEGLTGGLSAAPIAAIRGPKAAAQPVQQDELQKLRDEEEKRLAEERKFKESPDYAQQVVQQYDELAKQKKDLVAQIKKIDKESPTADADRAFNRNINAQIKELEKQIKPLAEDYYKSRGMLGRIAEQERIAKLTPQEYAFGLEPETEEQKKALEPELYEQQIATPPKPTVELTPREKAAQYARQRIATANEQQYVADSFAPKFKAETTKAYVDYLMQDPELAQQVVENRVALEGLPKGLSNAEVLDALKLQVKPMVEAKKKAELQKFETEMGVRKEALGATKKVEDEDQTVAALRDWMDESKGKFLPVSDSDFNYLNGMFEKAFDKEPVIAVSADVKPIARGPQMRERIDALIEEADKADQAYRTARYAMPSQGKRGAPERAAAMEALTKGKVALEKIEQLSKSGGAYAREVIAARRAQQEAMAKLSDITEQLRTEQTLGGNNKEMAASTEQSLINRASQVRGQLVSSALKEAALHRRAAGNPAVSQDEALKAASVMYDAVNDWVARSNAKPVQPEFEEVVVQPAQMRADKIVRPAVTERRQVKAGTQAISPAEIAHFQERIKSAMRNLYEKPEVKTTRVETGPLKRQFAAEEAKKTAEAKGETATTLRGELARRKEYTTNLIDKALARKDVPENIRDGLERAKNMIEDGIADKRLLDAAENQAERVLRGQDSGQVTRMGREQVSEGTRVVRNVPGKEASTEFGVKGKKFVTTGTQEKAAQEKATFPKGAPVAVEGNEALRELEEAMSLNKRVAQEAAGQQSLFPEIQEDLGYIRATPANFAKSPRIKPVWTAIDNARALFKKTEPVRLAKEATRRNRIRLLNQLEERMDSIRKDTQFFWKDTSRWSDAELAKVFVGMPEAGTTQAEKDLLYRYAKGQQLTPQEKITASKLVRDFQTQELPKYQEKIKEAMQLLAQGRRLTDVDNQLLSFMQDTNANVKAAAKALSERMAGMRKTVEYLKEVMRGSVMLSPEQKALLDSEKAVEKQRGEYQLAVEKAITKATGDMNAARAALLDPQIGQVSKELKAAKNTLDKEQAELDKINKRFEGVLSQEEGANRTELATYELFRYEEKKGVIDDLKAKIQEQEEALEKLVTERHEEFDGAAVVIQAMLDSNVKMERQYLEMQEATLASMRGESVLDKPNAYPFAYRQAKKNLEAQKPIVQAAERRATKVKEAIKTDQQQMEDFWKDKLGGEGIKREEGKVEPIQTTAEKEAEKLRIKAMEALDREEDAFIRTARKEAAFNQYVGDITDLMLEAESIPGPDDINELKKIINDETQSDNTRIMAMAKVGALQAMESVEAQYEVEQEGKPKRKQKPATTLSSVGQAKGKPLRTGSVPASQSIKTLLSPEKKRERMKDTLDLDAFVSSDDVRGIFGGGRTSVDFSEARTLFDLDFDAMSMGPTFTYKGTPVSELADATERSLLSDLHSMYMRAAAVSSKHEHTFKAAKSRILVGLKSDANLYKNSNPTLSARIQKRVDLLESMTADDVVITVPGGGFRATATLSPAKLKEEAPLKVTDSQANNMFRRFGAAIDPDVGYNGLSFAQAAEYGAKHAKNANQKVLFERMQEIFADAKPDKYSGRVFASSKILNSIRGSAAGYYIPALDMVVVSEAKIDPMKTLLHELVHAASVKMLAQDKALNNRVTVLRERVEQWSYTPAGEAWLEKNLKQSTFDGMPYFPDLYGLTNNKEFIAEVFANPEFQKVLAEIPSDMPRKNLLTRLVEFLSRSFSMPAKAMQSLFAESMVLTEEIMQRTKTEIYEAGVDPRLNELAAPLIVYDNPEFEDVRATMQKVVAQNKTWWDKVKANTTGLAFETQLVDRFAGFERLAKYMDKLKGTQMLYYLRTYDQRMNIVSKAVADGAPVIKEVTRKDGRVERLVETSGGANIASIVNKLREAQPYIGNGEAVNQVFTTYMAAIRAKNKGIETLNFGTDKDGKPVLTQAMLDKVTALVENNKPLRDVFEAARKEYNQYNRDMLDFVASTGALSKELVKRLVAQDDYIPFYRERKGVVELVIGNESPVRIGSIADQPYLQELVGGDTAILDFMTSSVQNTNMLVDMGMRNLATKNAVMELVDLKAATLVKKADGKDVVKFKVDGDDRYAIIATEKVTIGSKEFETGVPADILVKGMEGIPTQMPFLLRAMAMPAQVLRKAITLSPVYMARQLFRDSLAAPILSGADFMPIIGAVKEINSATKQTLEKRGITGGQQFKGTSEDLSMILREISDGKPGWMKALGALEATSMELDAATRRAQYNSYIEQGLSEMEATLMALESMNFNKRGASPSIHVANALIPFFNAQIQGLNVMYKAMAGKMPFNDQLRIREKMLMRGGMMAGATILYAMMMQDDEAYKNATPDQKYGNWFIRVPGLDEPLKFPIPFEIGYIFKAIPEALYNSMTQKHGGEEAVQAFNQILIQTLPGGSSMPTIDVGGGLKIPTLIPLPQAVKPVIETALEKSFYTGRDILSEREKKLLPEQQFRNNTSEAAKLVGSTFGLSPIKMEALVSGYTGTMGLAFLHAISLGVPAKETPEQAVKRLSEYPIVGGVFQPNDAGGIINSVYMRLNEDERVRSTVRTLFNEGKAQEAQALLTKRGAEYMEAELGDKFKANMNKLTQAERAIAASNLSAEAKRAQLDDIRKMKIALANMTREISDKTIRLSGFS